METKHTPGPWGVAYTDSNGQLVVKNKHIEIATCWHHSVASIEAEMQANARLIAAAPELYIEAFELIGDLDPENTDRRFDGLRAALAKAEGR